MFVPIGFLIGLLVSRRLLWVPVLVVPVLSSTMEVLQGAFLSQRFASALDVVANTVGGLLGLSFVLVLRLFMEGRDRKLIARALWEHDEAARRGAIHTTTARPPGTATTKTEFS